VGEGGRGGTDDASGPRDLAASRRVPTDSLTSTQNRAHPAALLDKADYRQLIGLAKYTSVLSSSGLLLNSL